VVAPVFDHVRPVDVDWRLLDVDIVVEATGRFRRRDQVGSHIARGGARKVVLTSPGSDTDATIVMGVNSDTYSPDRHDIVSNTSCTTNCATPMAHVAAARLRHPARTADHRARLHRRSVSTVPITTSAGPDPPRPT